MTPQRAPDYDPQEEHPGAHAFSEPEAIVLKELVEEFKPHAWVNVHSGMEALFMPFDHKSETPTGAGAEAMEETLKKARSCLNWSPYDRVRVVNAVP